MMKKIFTFSAVMAAMLFVGLPLNAESQSPSFLNVLPTNVILSKTELAQGEPISGLFVAVNTSNTPGSNLFYSVSVIGSGSEFGRTDYTDERFNLLPLERKTLQFSFVPPKALAGRDLLLKIQVWEETGIPQGSAKASIFINGTSTIAYTESARVIIGEKSFDPLEGVLVSSETDATLRVVLLPGEYNETDKIYPSGGIFKRSVFEGDKVKDISLAQISFQGRTTIDYVLEKDLPAGVYQGILSFNNAGGESVAPSIYFRYIIPGTMGTIHGVTADVSNVKKGDAFNLTLSITGAAGGPNMTDFRGFVAVKEGVVLEVSVINEKSVVIASASKSVDPNTETSITLPLTADGNGISLSARAVLKSEKGSILDDKTFILSTGELDEVSSFGKETLFVAIIIFLVIIFIFLAIYLFKKKRQAVPSVMIILVALLSGSYGLSKILVEETFGQSGGAPQFVETGVDQNDYKVGFETVLQQKSASYYAEQVNIDANYTNVPLDSVVRTVVDQLCGQSPCPNPGPHLATNDFESFRTILMGIPCSGPCQRPDVLHWDPAITGGGFVDSSDNYILRPLAPGEEFRVSFNSTLHYCSNAVGNLYTKVEHVPDNQIYENIQYEGDATGDTFVYSDKGIVTNTFTAPSEPGTYELKIFSANYPASGEWAVGFSGGLGHDQYLLGNNFVRGWREVTVTYTVEGEGAPQGVGTGNLWCGSADGETFENPPTINLCGTGTATEATPNSDQYVWACEVDDVTSGAVGLWKLNDGSGTTASDGSGSGTSGTLTNMTPASDWVAGIEGTALDFDGTNDKVIVPDSAPLDLTGSFSMSTWIYPRSFGGSSRGRVIDKNVSSLGYMIFLDNVNTTSGVTYVRDYSGTVGNNVISNSNAITLNTWQHLVFVFNSGNNLGTFYVNGIAVGSSVVNGSPGANTVNLSIGGKSTDDTRQFDGLIDDVRLYNRVLTTDEIGALYDLQGVPSNSQDCSATRTCPTGEEVCLNGCALVGECSLSCGPGQTMCSDGLCRADCAVCNAGDCDFQINPTLDPKIVDPGGLCGLTWEVVGRTIPVDCTLDGQGVYTGSQTEPVDVGVNVHRISCTDGTTVTDKSVVCTPKMKFEEY